MSSYTCLWIIVPLLLLTMTNLPTWQILILLVVFALIFRMLQMQKILKEGFFAQCRQCINPYVIQKLAQAHDQSLIEKEEKKPKVTIIKPLAAVPLTAQQAQQLKAIQEAELPKLPPKARGRDR